MNKLTKIIFDYLNQRRGIVLNNSEFNIAKIVSKKFKIDIEAAQMYLNKWVVNVKEDEEIIKMIEERDKHDNGVRYTSEDVTRMREVIKNRIISHGKNYK